MNKLFTYLLALCTATCLYGCSEELEEMTSTKIITTVYQCIIYNLVQI